MTRFKHFVSQAIALVAVATGLITFVYQYEGSFGEKSKDHIVFTKDNLVVLDSEVDQASVADVMTKARLLKGCPIYLFLNTPGGSVPAGLEMFDTLKGLSCPVKTVSRFAASMGFQTVQNLEERLVLPNGILMSHHARGQFSGEYGGKRPAQVDSRLNLAVQQFNELDEITVARTKGKQTLKSYTEAYNPELWLTAKQAIAGGYADRIVTASCDSSLDGSTPAESSFMNANVAFEKANCPLISGPIKVDVKLPTTGGPMTYEEFMRQGGKFGPACLKSTKLCALDSMLTPEKVKELRSAFLRHYTEQQNTVVPAYW